MRYALGLEYDGRAFCGWQAQPSGRGIQNAVQRAVSAIAGHPVMVTCAGRTDAGVHATAQVVHFDTGSERPDTAWTRGVNTWLQEGISVLWSRRVADSFHARYEALSRSYRYILLERRSRPGLHHGRVGWWPTPLDVPAMAVAAGALLGTHDFSTFRAAECQARSPVRTMLHLEVRREGEFIEFDLRANAFLHHMVRNIVGSLVQVGAGRRTPEWIAGILAARNRQAGAPTFAADGLYLAGVEYDPAHGIPAFPDRALSPAPVRRPDVDDPAPLA